MINKAILMGRLARDPKLQEFANGGVVCKLRLITSRSYRDQATGEFVERSEGHNIAIWKKGLAERINEKCRQGDLLHVEGLIETRRWQDSDGQTHYMTEITIRPFNGAIRRIPQGTRGAGAQESSAPTEDQVPETGSPADDIFDDEFFDDGFEGFDDFEP